MPTRRLFIALPLPEPIQIVLSRLAAESLPGARWTPLHQLHVTMRFLGEVDDARLPAIVERLSTIQVEPFLLPVEGVGAFPAKGGPPRVLWAGLGNAHPRLHQLRKQIDEALLNLGLDFDVSTFHPHISLARCTPDAAPAVAKWLRTHTAFEGPSFRVDAFDLLESELRPAGALHHVIEHIRIAAGSSA